MIEPLSVAFHAVNRVPLAIDDAVVVVGVGMIGLLLIQTLRLKDCGQIIAIDIDQNRLDLACRLGADVGLRSDQVDIPKEVGELTHQRGADAGFEAVGIHQTVNTAIRILRKGGSLGLVGNISPEIGFPLQFAVTRELTIFASCASAGEYPACLDMLARNAIDVSPLISEITSLADGNAWFQKLYVHEPGLLKVILQP